MARERLSVGMFFSAHTEVTGKETVVGAGVAVTTFVPMLDRHADPRTQVAVHAPSLRVDAVSERLARLARPRKSRIEVRSVESLASPAPRLPTVWHDINADVRRPFALRGALDGAFPIAITHHTVSYTFFIHEWFLPLLLADVRPFDSIICTSTAARTAIANVLEHLAESVQRAHGARVRYRGRLDVVPLGVDITRFRPQAKRAVRRRLRLPLERSIVLWVGRFSAADKADLLPLVRAFARVVAETKGKRPLLVLAGTDRNFDSAFLADYAARLGIADAVRIVRGLDPTTRHDWFAAADVFVSPVDNIQETFGLTPIEAMACGVPAIVSDWDGYKDTVVDGETGFRIPTRWARCDADINAIAPVIYEDLLDHLAHAQAVVVDFDLLAHRMLALLDDAALRRRMGSAARARTVSRYGWQRVISEHEALWRDQIAQSRRASPRKRPAWSLMPAFDAFGHYATEHLDRTTRIEITALGRAILDGEEPLPVYHADGRVLVADALEDALASLGARARGVTLGGLAGAIAKHHALGRDAALRHALWLLKYGHARVVR